MAIGNLREGGREGGKGREEMERWMSKERECGRKGKEEKEEREEKV